MSASGSKGIAEWQSFWTVPVAAALGYSIAVHPRLLDRPVHRAAATGVRLVSRTSFRGNHDRRCRERDLRRSRRHAGRSSGAASVGLIGALLMAAGFALLGSATGEIANWFLLWGILAFGTLWVQSTVWTSAVASRFETSRGLAFAVTLSGASLGATVFPILAASLIGAYGWRTAFAATGGIWLALVFPILFLFFRGARDEAGRQGVAVPDPAKRADRRESVRRVALVGLLQAAARGRDVRLHGDRHRRSLRPDPDGSGRGAARRGRNRFADRRVLDDRPARHRPPSRPVLRARGRRVRLPAPDPRLRAAPGRRRQSRRARPPPPPSSGSRSARRSTSSPISRRVTSASRTSADCSVDSSPRSHSAPHSGRSAPARHSTGMAAMRRSSCSRCS